MNSTSSNNTAFLSDLTDGREKGKWESRFVPEALREIKWERNYLIIMFFCALFFTVLMGLIFDSCLFPVPECIITIKIYIFGVLGGLLGGTIFSMKWLVHSVAKNTWNIDRRLWRVLTPLLSSAIALLIVLLINSDFLHIDEEKGFTIYKSYAIGFLAGYFSDNAIGKLTEIAQVLFGSNISKEK